MKVALLVCQRSCKVVLDVGVHDGSEVVEAAVPEQVNDEHLRAGIETAFPQLGASQECTAALL